MRWLLILLAACGEAVPVSVEAEEDALPAEPMDADSTDAAQIDVGGRDATAPDLGAPDTGTAVLDAGIPPTAGQGVPHEGAPEVGVECLGVVCAAEQVCRFLVAESGCYDAGGRLPDQYGVVACDGPEDCPGAVCCYQASGMSTVVDGACVAADTCLGERIRTCNTRADCPPGGACVRGWSAFSALRLGVCQSFPDSGCVPGPEAACAGADLTGFDLANTLWTRADLREARLGGCFLRGADFTDARMNGADLSASRLEIVTFSGADLRGARFQGRIIDSLLENARLQGAHLRDTYWQGTSLVGADLTDADTQGAVGIDVICPDGALLERTGLAGAFCEGHLL